MLICGSLDQPVTSASNNFSHLGLFTTAQLLKCFGFMAYSCYSCWPNANNNLSSEISIKGLLRHNQTLEDYYCICGRFLTYVRLARVSGTIAPNLGINRFEKENCKKTHKMTFSVQNLMPLRPHGHSQSP